MDKREILVSLLGEETVSKMADRAGGGLDRFGKSLDATERDAKDLDRQIADVEGSLKILAVAFARTGDAADRMDLTKAMRKQQAELRKLTKSRDLLPDLNKAGEEAASGFGASFIARVGPLLAKAPVGPAGLAIGSAIAVTAVPTISAAIAGAVVGGVGIGGVVGGATLAAKDARVQAAGKQLAEAVTSDLEKSGTRFVTPMIRGIQIIQGAWDDVSGDIDSALESASRYVEPLAKGVANFARELAPGLREAADAAGPIVDVLSEELPEVGAELSHMLSTFADDADEGASALRFVFRVAEDGIAVVTDTVHAFAEMYRVLVSVADAAVTVAEATYGWAPLLGDQVDRARDKVDAMKSDLEAGGKAGGEAGQQIEGGLMKAADAADTAQGEVRSLQDALDEFAGMALDARAADREFEQAIDDATESLKANGRTLADGTEKGRANQAALDDIAQATRRKAAATLAATGSQEQANAVTNAGRAAFLRAAEAMGMEAGKARALANQLFGIPNIDRSVEIRDKEARAAIDRVVRAQGRIKDVYRGIYFTVKGDLKLPGGTSLKGAASGGPVLGSGPKGVDSVPMLLAPGEHVLTAREVDAAGGHAGIERIRALLRGGGGSTPAAAGLSAPAGGAASMVNQFQITVNVPPTANAAEVGRVTVEAIRAYEQRSGSGWRR